MIRHPPEGRAQQSLKQSKSVYPAVGKVPDSNSEQELHFLDRYFPERHLKTYMCPQEFPTFNPTVEKKSAEKKCFDLFNQIDEPMVVIHSYEYCMNNMGETDFVIIHKTRGIMVFEVKGITTTQTKHLKSRFSEGKTQLSKASIAIKRILDKHLKLKHKPVGYAVAMPNVPIATFERNEVLNKEHLASKDALQKWLDDYRPQAHAFSDEQFDRCIFYFADLFGHLKSWNKIHESLNKLTPDQAKVLSGLPDEFYITGPAGSGKTEVMIHHAAEEQLSEHQKLIVVYHRALADYVTWRLKEIPKVRVVTFNELMEDLIKTVYRRDYLNNPYAPKSDLMSRVISILSNSNNKYVKYDSIFVDEGQDMEGRNWELLIDVLHNKRPSHLKRIFFDDNQMVSYSHPPKPPDSNVYHLRDVIRNTRNVFKTSEFFYQSKPGRPCKPSHECDGPKVTWNDIFTECDLDSFSNPVLTFIFQCIEEMWNELGTVAPMDIAILVENEERATDLSRKIEQSVISNVIPFSAKEMVRCLNDEAWPVSKMEPRKCGVVVESISKYKGLGSKAVILVVSTKCIKAQLIEKMYAGITRSSCKLVVIVSKNGHEFLESKIGKRIPSTTIDEPMDIDCNANSQMAANTMA